MKKKLVICLGAVIVFTASCKKFLDINANPNRPITNTPELVMPQAVVGTASFVNSDYNTYGADLMYRANAGGFSGFGTVISYDYTTGSLTNLWGLYDNIEDYKYIKDQTAGNPRYVYYNAAARIMMAHDYQLLVDTYNDIPYTDALLGVDNISPKYDKAQAIYKDLAAQIDTAIGLINSGLANPQNVVAFTAGSDPLFFQTTPAQTMALWKQFANTVKLRLIVRAGSTVQFNNKTFSTDGFITADAMVNPGYTKVAGKISPIFPYSATGTASTSSRLPSTFALSFYDGTKLNDQNRGTVVYRNWPNPANNQLGNENNPTPPNSPVPNSWIKPSIRTAGTVPSNTTYNTTVSGTDYGKVGIQKDYIQGAPLITAAESYFLQAEAVVRGYITGDAAALFNSGIEASYIYLYKDGTNTLPGSGPYSKPAADAAAYRAANATNYLANFNLATTLEAQIEAIITQKYIALNMIHSHEAWNEYRRTGYPRVTGSGPTQTMASTVSVSTRPDKMPTRILYPASEFNTNSTNVPKDVDKFKSLIFWAK